MPSPLATRHRAYFLITFCVLGIAITSILSLSIGSQWIPIDKALQALSAPSSHDVSHIIVQTSRLPRALYGIMIGASLAVAGCLMQALTRNALASPSIFGINSGATFFIVAGGFLFKMDSIHQIIGIALLGATLTAILVYLLGIGPQKKIDSLRIVLAGAAISALFSSFTNALLVIDQESLDGILFWLAGSIANRELNILTDFSPYIFTALLIAILLSPAIKVLINGEDIAKGLGQNTFLTQSIMGAVIVVLAASSVALAGNIAFIGLLVPHIVKRILISKTEYQWIIPCCITAGAFFMLAADMISRLIIFPQEAPIGVMTAFIGVPLFIYLIKRGN